MREFRLERQPPQTRDIACSDGARYTISLPEFYCLSEKLPDRDRSDLFHSVVSLLYRIQGNFYAFMPEPLSGDQYPEGEYPPQDPTSFFFSETFPADATFFWPNRNLMIQSWKHWHDLTRQNPNFMQEQFDPQCVFRGAHFYINPEKEIYTFLNSNFAYYGLVEQQNSRAIAKFQGPTARTINFCGELVRLSLPKLALVRTLAEESHNLCLANTRGNKYIPLYLPNVDDVGDTCMGDNFIDHLEQPFDYFWNSEFNTELSDSCPPFHINENLTISSFKHWQYLTQQNPNFFQQQFDPIHAERNAYLVFSLDPVPDSEESAISWTLQ